MKKNLLKKKESKISDRPASLGVMIKLIKSTYPKNECDDNFKLARLIEEEFNTTCSAEGIENFLKMIEYENYNKESRLQKFRLGEFN